MEKDGWESEAGAGRDRSVLSIGAQRRCALQQSLPALKAGISLILLVFFFKKKEG